MHFNKYRDIFRHQDNRDLNIKNDKVLDIYKFYRLLVTTPFLLLTLCSSIGISSYTNCYSCCLCHIQQFTITASAFPSS